MKKWILITLLSLFMEGIYSTVPQNDILEAIRSGTEKLINSNEVSPSLKKAISDISKIKNKTVADDTFCQSCETVINAIIVYRRIGASRDSMISYFKKLCQVFTDWGDVACNGFIDIEIEIVLYIIDNKRNLTPQRVCAIYFQARKCLDPDAKKWDIPLPPQEESNENKLKNEETEPLKILQLTDIHYDPLYTPGSNAVCKEPLCCQNGIPSNPKNRAGFWGDYNVCDMPQHSVENLLAHIEQKHLKDIDFVYYTGDIVSHKSWATSIESNTKTIKEIYGLFSKSFRNKTVYPILGNHESHPTDSFSSDNILQKDLSTQWIFNLSVSEWSRWLPEDTHTSIRKGGYYTLLVKPGFRIIAVNSNVCFTSNLWLFYEDEDPYQQLSWLVEELHKAEKNNEKVHILSHIPPGEILCHKQWSNQFRKIVNRFADTISAQFNGHTHVDELKVFYDPNDPKRVINVAFNGGSFTTFIGYNPNYRIYEVNPSSTVVENYSQYIYNLTKANINKYGPEWYKLYSFKEAYGLENLNLGSFGTLTEKMSKRNELLWQYFRFSVRDSDVQLKAGCNTKCLKRLLCYITAVETNDSVNC